MTRRARLIFLLVSLLVLILVGRLATGSFDFIFQDFWFTAGLFLVVFLALVDQPFFSLDADIFANGVTGYISLLVVPQQDRNGVWWLFLIWSAYLAVSSFALLWIRSRSLRQESWLVQLVARVNRQIGRPQALFSAFFIWGLVLQFGTQSSQFNALFLFWVVFMVLNIPAVAQAIDSALSSRKTASEESIGQLLRVVSPRIVEASLSVEAQDTFIGQAVKITTRQGQTAGKGVVIDDRVIAGQRLGRLAITSTGTAWTQISAAIGQTIELENSLSPNDLMTNHIPLSVVDTGSDIGKTVFQVHPDIELKSGQIVWTQEQVKGETFYQIVAGQVFQSSEADGNSVQSVKVTASQLGKWKPENCCFEPVPWVAPAGQLIFRGECYDNNAYAPPQGNVTVGRVPNSDFPVHVNLQDIVTHNTAIVGVTGSGKSYLAFHIIRNLVENQIKVLILDLSREHWLYHEDLKPTALSQPGEVASWLQGDSRIGINQYTNSQNYPQTTADFVQAAYQELSKSSLTAGVNLPARLCVVLEEAHSLIPEWNQVAQPNDTQQVNRTARTILQGRKYGMGCIIVTQRTANVTKTVLNQCNTIFALQSFDQTGLDFLRNYMGEEYSQAISTLPSRHAILVGKASSSARPIMVSIEDFSTRWNNQE